MTTIGYLGLGKMGLNMAQRLLEHGVPLLAWNRGEEGRARAAAKGVPVASTIKEVIAALPVPRVVWLMVPSASVDEVLDEVVPLLSRGDTIIDGGNCYYKETVARGARLKRKGINFIDAGVSGGPAGALLGACVMVGGEATAVRRLEPLFCAMAAPNAYVHAGALGAGHFVKMVHNGIEYGMMQALAEGFALLKKSPYKLDIAAIADLYNHRSVIESRLVGWLSDAYKVYGNDLKAVSGSVAHTGEGEWTVKTAKQMGIPAPIIEGAFRFRVQSVKAPSYTGKVLSALRNQFGGHAIEGASAVKKGALKSVKKSQKKNSKRS